MVNAHYTYLTYRELSQTIKIPVSGLRKLVMNGIFVQNVHYVRPTPRRTLFIHENVIHWLHGHDGRKPDACRKFKKRTRAVITPLHEVLNRSHAT